MSSRSRARAADKSSPGAAAEPDVAAIAVPAAAAVAETLMARAQQYGMRTGLTDWAKVGQVAGRSQQATAALARTVDDLPLRAIPPSRR